MRPKEKPKKRAQGPRLEGIQSQWQNQDRENNAIGYRSETSLFACNRCPYRVYSCQNRRPGRLGVRQATELHRPCLPSRGYWSSALLCSGLRGNARKLTKSQLGAPGNVAPSSPMLRLEAPRAKLARLRQRQRAQAVEQRLSRSSTLGAVEPRSLPPRGAILEGVQ